MNLYDIDNAILECVDEYGEIIDSERLSALEMERDSKISNIACWIKDLKAEAEAIKAEKQNLDKRQKSAENKAEQLKNYLAGYLDGAKYKDARCSISYRTSVETVVEEGTELPEELTKVTISPDKTAIKKALQNGEEVKGCYLVEKSNIQIK